MDNLFCGAIERVTGDRRAGHSAGTSEALPEIYGQARTCGNLRRARSHKLARLSRARARWMIGVEPDYLRLGVRDPAGVHAWPRSGAGGAANALGILSTVGLRNLLRPAIIRETVDT